MKKDNTLKDVRVAFRINSRDYDELNKVAKERGLDVSKLITYSIEPFLLKRKIDNVIDAVEGSSIKDIERLMASKNLLEHYISKLDEMKRELQSKVDNIVLGNMVIQMQKKDSPVIVKVVPSTKKKTKKELQEA